MIFLIKKFEKMNLEDIFVSGAPGRIYSLNDSLFEFHEVVRDVNRAAASGVQYLFDIFPSAYYRHAATLDMIVDRDHPWSQEVLDSYNSHMHCHAAASVLVEINDATIKNSVIFCRRDEDITILYETYRFPDRVSGDVYPNSIGNIKNCDFEMGGGPFMYLGSAGSFNYGHWLVDDLPRAKAWLDLRRKLGVTCTILLPAHGDKIDEIRVQSLRSMIDRDIEVQFVDPNRPLRIRNLYYPTPVSFHPRIKNPLAINFLRSCAANCVPEREESQGRKLFVARRPPHSRAIINFHELWGFLEERGFEFIEAEKLDFLDQVAIFQNSSVVVGQMGAAMTNTLFCRPATNLVYLAPVGWKEPFYLDLAAVGGQQYQVLFGETVGSDLPYLSDFEMRVDHLYHRLTYMGLTAIR